MIRKRIRIIGAEPCLRCGAGRKSPCLNYLRKPKATCHVVIGCVRCAAQPGRCKHPDRRMQQRDLFPLDSPAWIAAALLAAVGAEADDQRRSVR